MVFATPINNVGAAITMFVNVFVFTMLRTSVCNAQAVPALYMLGDSLVDVGNNNYLPLSVAKANFPHNGVDFPNRKFTGRFSNGENAADFIAKKLGLRTSPPYLSLTDGTTPPITGVSFASGSSGILNETGQPYIQYISLAQQVDYFSLVRDKLVQQLGPSVAQVHLSKSIFPIVIASNDLITYFTVGSLVSRKYTPQRYIDLLLSNYKGLLKTLYALGAQKMVVTGAPTIGCCPSLRKSSRTGECNAEANFWSKKYNDGLKVMLQELKSESLGLNYAYFDIYSAMINLFLSPETYGFTNIKEACCGLGYLNADVPCIPTSTFCLNRRNHFFWDLYHPTEVAASMFIDIMYNGTQPYMFPINLKQLADI
uniref:GDSL esterase/lipase At5g55050-like n=1 Tax=Erigeron canadensis TaxID=72917 RepID=UPI001CB96638|nr:GDSL esterase/lipase At5g55050-like [Erigeron canadensis]